MEKYLDAQAGRFTGASDYETALREIREGRKITHWIWYVFPQIDGISKGDIAKRYAIENLNRAKEFYAHPVLGRRLVEISSALLELDTDDPVSILGHTDALKLRSCMTLFAEAAPEEPVFRQVLDKFCMGNPDYNTLDILEQQSVEGV